MKSTTVLLTLLGVGMAVLMSRSAQAAIVVGSCMGTAKYTTIQDAVNAAPSGSVIKVCPGGYPEQGGDRQAAHAGGHHHRRNRGRIYPSTRGGIVENDYPYSAQVLVQNTTGVTITNLIVDGTNSAPCGINYLAGIDFHNASGTVSKMAVRNQSAALSCGGCGVAALVDYGQQAQNVTLQNNDFRNQSTVAIYGSGSGLTLNTQNNFIAGPEKGETVGIMYNYATGAIQGNSVVDEVFPQATFATPSLLDAMGIAVYCTTATVTNNMVSNTQLGIAVGCEFSNGPYASNTTISGNKIFNTRLQDGIYIFSTANRITSNTIVASAASGIHFDPTFGGNDASGNTVSGNSITEACAGILATGTATNTVSANSFNAVDVPHADWRDMRSALPVGGWPGDHAFPIRGCPVQGLHERGFSAGVRPTFSTGDFRLSMKVWSCLVCHPDTIARAFYDAFLMKCGRARCCSFICSTERTRRPRSESFASSVWIACKRSCLWP